MTKKIINGSKNVFEDLGTSHPKQSLARATLMSIITEEIRSRGLTQSQAGGILDLPQSKVSNLMNGKLGLFSLEHLCRMLKTLGNTVYITVRTSKIKKPERFLMAGTLIEV